MKLNFKKILSLILCVNMIASVVQTLSVSAAIPDDSTTAAEWTARFTGNVDAKIELDTQNFYEGKASLKFVSNTPTTTGKYMKVFTPVNVQAGKTYKAGFVSKSLNSQKMILMFSSDKRRNMIPFSDTYEWIENEVEYTATSTGTVNMEFLVDGLTEGFWIDNVYFKEVETGVNLIKNPGFEVIPKTEEKDNFGAEITGLEDTYNKICASENFTQSEFEHVRGGFKFMPIYKVNNITVDGKKDDWENIMDIYMPTLSSQYKVFVDDGETLDASVRAKFAYNEDNFYLYIEATDDIYNAVSGETYWTGDSIQFTVSRMDELYGIEIGVSHNETTGMAELYSSALGKDALAQIDAKSTRVENTTIYEICMPWILFFNERYSRPEEFLFDVLYNDNDGSGRRYSVELAPGIASGKTNTAFPVLRLLEDSKPWYSWIAGNKSAIVGVDTEYSLYIVNGKDEEVKFDVILPDGKEKSQIISAHMGVRIPFNMLFEKEELYNLEAKISEDGYTYTAAYEISAALAPPSVEEVNAYIEDLKDYVKVLNGLINKCEEKGLSTHYEQVNCSTIEKFIVYLKRDVDNNDLLLYHYQKRCLDNLYTQAKADLEAYLRGEKKPLTVPTYVTSEIRTENTAVWAKTDVNGKIVERPLFFVGYGHFEDAEAEIPNFNNFGVNTIQSRIEPEQVIVPVEGPTDWGYYTRGGVNASVEVQSDVVKEGKYALKVVNKTPKKSNTYIAFYQSIAVEPNTTYVLGGWSKVENSTGFFVYTAGGGWADPVFFGSNGTSHDWQRFEKTFTTGPNETTRLFRFVSQDVTDVGYLDGLYLKKEGSDKNLLSNGDFEEFAETYDDFKVSKSEIKAIQKILEDAEEHNISVCLLIALHNFPNFLLDKYPDMKYAPGYGMTDHNLMDERAKPVLEAYLKTLIPEIKDYVSLSSICLANEPQFWTRSAAEYYQPMWENYIKQKHGTLDALNEAYGTEYTSFEECRIPKTEANLALHYDYKVFNDTILSGWHNMMADIIKEIAPDIPLHTKIMDFPAEVGVNRLMMEDGTKLENYTSFLDWNGNDTSNRYENKEEKGPFEQLITYDYQRSIMNAPVIDSENHITLNGSKIYGDEITNFIIQTMWEGALHGRAFTQNWVWERNDSETHGGTEFSGSTSYRPDALAGVGRITHDLNRLSYEVVAVQDEPADVGILYSDTSGLHTRQFGNIMRWTHAGTLYAGKKVQFVTEEQIEKLKNVKALIIPRTINVKESTLKAVYNFVLNGGKVMIIDEKSLTLNEYAKPHDAGMLKYIQDNSQIVRDVVCNNTDLVSPTKKELFVLIRDFIKKSGMEYIRVVDADTGENADEVLMDVGIYNGKLLVNVCSYGENKTLKIMVGDRVVEKSFDLIANQELGESFETKLYVSRFLEIDVEHSFVDVYGHWAEDYITGLSQKELISGMSESRFEPNGVVTRAEFLTMLVRASGIAPATYSGGFGDVYADDWFAGYVSAAMNAGIVSGESFRPNDQITREEMCKMLVAFYGADKISASDMPFTDTMLCNDKETVSKAFALGFISGYDDGTFKPQKNMSRAEASVVVTKYLAKK